MHPHDGIATSTQWPGRNLPERPWSLESTNTPRPTNPAANKMLSMDFERLEDHAHVGFAGLLLHGLEGHVELQEHGGHRRPDQQVEDAEPRRLVEFQRRADCGRGRFRRRSDSGDWRSSKYCAPLDGTQSEAARPKSYPLRRSLASPPRRRNCHPAIHR